MIDPIPTHLLANFIDPLLPAITKLVNSSLDSGIVPTKFKTKDNVCNAF